MKQNKCRVDFIEYCPHITVKINPTKFCYSPDVGWKWLQKICFFALQKLKAFSFVEEISYTRHTIRTDSFMENLIKQKRGLVDLYHYHGSRLLIGPDQFYALTGEPDIRTMINFDAEYRFGLTIHKMQVTIIPWMDGILVLPKEM